MWIDLAMVAILLLASYYTGIFKGAPFVPTNKHTLDQMIELAEIKPGDFLADLGSGDGRILVAAARAGATAHGYEINPFLVVWSIYKIRKAGMQSRAFVHWKSFWRADLTRFSIVTLFGITGIMGMLEEKLQAELRPGSRVLSNIFKFPTWKGEKIDSVTVYRIEKTS